MHEKLHYQIFFPYKTKKMFTIELIFLIRLMRIIETSLVLNVKRMLH